MHQPGYMDAAYYVDGALSLYQGRGFNLPLIWNYLSRRRGGRTARPQPPLLDAAHLAVDLSLLFWFLARPFARRRCPRSCSRAPSPHWPTCVAHRTSRGHRPGPTQARAPPRPLRRALCHLQRLLHGLLGHAGQLCALCDRRRPLPVGLGARLGAPIPPQSKPAWFAVAGLCAGLAHLTRADGVLLLCTGLLAGSSRLARLVTHKSTRGQDRCAWAETSRSLSPAI